MELEPTPVFPVEIFEHLVSVSCFSQLLALRDVNFMFKALVITEIQRRFKRMNALVSKAGLSPEDTPVIVYLINLNSTECKAKEGENGITISGTSFILKFLRLVGSNIKHIVCNLSGATEEQTCTFFSHINENCPNLVRIVINSLQFDLKDSLKNPFINVQYILFKHSRVSGRLFQFDEYFPNVQLLLLDV